MAVPPALLADGRLEVTYELVVQPAGSPEHEQRHLLPYRRVDAAPDQQVFTGWKGFSVGPQVGGAPGSFPDGNGIFAIGRSFGHSTSDTDGTVLEVAQFAPGSDATMGVAEDARTAIASFARGTGRGPRNPVRIFIEGARGGGTHTDLGLVIDLPDTVPLPDDMKLLLAHELFHDWLGSSLVDDGSLVWFSEGFTDYFAIWHAVAAGMLPPARFAERILGVEREARSGSPLGRIAFAQPGVNWRDDGP